MNRLRFTLLLSILFLACGPSAQDPETNELSGKLSTDLVHNPSSLESQDSSQYARISFTDTLHNFGRVKEGETLEYDFTFTNKGTKDLIISEAKGSCGCTVPTFPDKPVKAGEQGIIKVTFNSSGRKGYNEKSVVVISNSNPSVSNLYIQAEVQ